MELSLRGLYVPLITPFTEEGDVALGALEKLAHDVIDSGAADRARELGHRLALLSAALFAEPNPAVIKGVLHAQGRIPSPVVRLPLLPASQDTVRAAVSLLGQVHSTAARP